MACDVFQLNPNGVACGIFQLKKYSIIEVAEAMCNVVQKRKIVILLNLKVTQDRDSSQSHAHNPAQRDINITSKDRLCGKLPCQKYFDLKHISYKIGAGG